MTIGAKIIVDSVHDGRRLTTFQLRYPRFIHSEFMTHRVFSRNASSSRAIPVERLIEEVMTDPAMPIHWGKNQPGMQAREEHESVIHMPNDGTLYAQDAWLHARDNAVDMARRFVTAGYHKQIVNRLLEPFAHINVVVTATDWDNFFALRIHEDAQPEIRALAEKMKYLMDNWIPLHREEDEWHLPYITPSDAGTLDELARMSAARCARVSYGEPRPGDDLALANKLKKAGHWSPFEHQAYAEAGAVSANFKGWVQFRQEICV